MKIEITNNGRWYQSLTVKLILLSFLCLALLIPLEMIKSVIRERQDNAGQVKAEISTQWAGKQTVSGPVLNIPVRSVPAEKDEKPVTLIWHIMPESLDIRGTIEPEIRYRGIYRSVVYNSGLIISGEFVIPDDTQTAGYKVLADDAYFTLGVTDNRGLKGEVVLCAGDLKIEARPGTADQDIFNSGITFDPGRRVPEGRFGYSLKLSLSGSEGLYLTPSGKTTNVTLSSSWRSPSFTGSFLPVSREVGDNGFSASWQITHLNRNFPQEWKGQLFNPEASSFGAELFLPVDHYQKSWRSARYGILFIALTFLVLVFLEITRKEPVHIFHYFLVSLGLILFFSLLNSLSEHIGFNTAYLISSAATVIMITLFASSLMHNKRSSLIIFFMLSALYGFIFILLSLKDYAYMAGNIGLFILLAVVMAMSAKMRIFRGDTGANNG